MLKDSYEATERGTAHKAKVDLLPAPALVKHLN